MNDNNEATQTSYEEELKEALMSIGDNWPRIIGLALEKINKVLKMKDNTKVHKKGYHVINKGVNDLYKDIIKTFYDNCFPSFSFVDERSIIITLLLSDPLTDTIKEKIDKMRVENPNTANNDNENAREFSCFKIALLACVLCVMQDIYENLKQREKMPARFYQYLKCLRKIINNAFIERKNHWVFVDSKAKESWVDENPSKVEVFEDCEKSVKVFLKNIADNFKLVIHWAHWFYRLEHLIIRAMSDRIRTRNIETHFPIRIITA